MFGIMCKDASVIFCGKESVVASVVRFPRDLSDMTRGEDNNENNKNNGS